MIHRPAIKIVGLLLSLACLAFFANEAYRAFAHQPASLADSSLLRAIPIAMIPFLLAYAALAGAWYCLLRLLGLKASPSLALGIYLVTQIAKYLPGNVGHHIGRVYLAGRHGLPAFRVGLSMVAEMLLIVATACLLSLPLAPTLVERLSASKWGQNTVFYAGAAIVIGLSATLYLLRRHHAIASARSHLRAAIREARDGRAPWFLIGAIALSVLGLALAGSSLVALFALAAPLTAGMLAKGVALVCVAWIAGFLTPGAPAGLGVREAILLAGLSSMFDRQLSLEATIMFRGVSVASDLIAFICGVLLLRRSREIPSTLADP
ncbi:flippase-like domain-containing protein [Luteimonas sp. SX5]|uniref:Flippase-like domain-containing protein n=1 Tax=Luteimonas galliterrae TaxID=2940486 RepID=A0ABT0MID7_9GAMM|nr:lysylphosphatidylglycerol synthase domain-containing protein [Luteimonas galliterrae]MCL1634632.1 flippase-like domain-containing protein [Luteimonas galliterrae]